MKRKDAVASVWNLQDETFNMMGDYFEAKYTNEDIELHGMETHILRHIDSHPGVNITEMALALNKTPSACSQVIKKLLKKDVIRQERNQENRRVYNLFLTEKGEKACNELQEWDDYGLGLICDAVKGFSVEDMEKYMAIQRAVNKACGIHVAYMADILKNRK